jgi:hypothetical protein
MKKKEKIKWTLFWDMYSGGTCKQKSYEKIYIEAPEHEASVIFYNRFDHSPTRVSCTCCGEDYDITEHDSLRQATAYFRNCKYCDKTESYIEKPNNEYMVRELISLPDYLKQEDVLVIYDEDIEDSERDGTVPQEGYVWY